MKQARDLKVNDTFSKSGFKHTVKEIQAEKYINGKDSLMVVCDSFSKTYGNAETTFHFKLDTKIK